MRTVRFESGAELDVFGIDQRAKVQNFVDPALFREDVQLQLPRAAVVVLHDSLRVALPVRSPRKPVSAGPRLTGL